MISFLAAARSKDSQGLREATAHDAPTMAVDTKNRALLASVLNQGLSGDELADLASDLEGFQVVGLGSPTQSGQLRVTIGKPGPNGTELRRTTKTRKEKNGWKVMDLGKTQLMEKPIPRPAHLEALLELQGGWFATEYKADGDGPGVVGISAGADPDLKIVGENLVLRGIPAGHCAFSHHNDLKFMNMFIEKGSDEGKTLLAVYKLENGTLTICSAVPPRRRPGDFTVPKGSKRRLTVYKRKP